MSSQFPKEGLSAASKAHIESLYSKWAEGDHAATLTAFKSSLPATMQALRESTKIAELIAFLLTLVDEIDLRGQDLQGMNFGATDIHRISFGNNTVDRDTWLGNTESLPYADKVTMAFIMAERTRVAMHYAETGEILTGPLQEV